MSTKRRAVPSAFSQADRGYSMGQDMDDSDGDTAVTHKSNAKQGESVVTKRTLQNRESIMVSWPASLAPADVQNATYPGKAQREFRKRREARVRDLEERCRRFDQMGLEANAELQRVARNLKDENEALRGFVIRIGYGNMMNSILEGVGSSTQQASDNQFQPAFAGGFGGASDAKDGVEMPGMLPPDMASSQNRVKSSGEGRGYSRSKASPSTSARRMARGIQSYDTSWMEGGPGQRTNIMRKSSSDKISASSPSSDVSSSSSRNAPLLSLGLQQLGSSSGKRADQQRQPEFTTSTPDDSLQSSRMPNNAMMSLLGQLNGQMSSGNTDGSGMAGSAMLGSLSQQSPGGPLINNYGPYPVPHRTHQNEALLNPNPFPFAFNLSNEPPQPTSSWWEQMGGGHFTPGLETNELDEKAQAVANAQSNGGGAQSPFDLSVFLQGGNTPGGGFNLPGFDQNEENSFKMRNGAGSVEETNTDHMRMFIQLLERKVAEREAHTVATLGFQPPSQDPSQRARTEGAAKTPTITSSSALSPSGVYSRLAEHPAFLSTDARELEELVDALGTGAGRSPSEVHSEASQQSSEKSMNRRSDTLGKPSPPQSSAGGSSGSPPLSEPKSAVEVDERAIDRLLGLLDRKRILRSLDQEGAKAEALSMTMA